MKQHPKCFKGLDGDLFHPFDVGEKVNIYSTMRFLSVLLIGISNV